MKIKKIVLAVISIILVIGTLMICILRSDSYQIRKCFEIDLPNKTKILNISQLENEGVGAHILINKIDLDSFVKSIKESGYSSISVNETLALNENQSISWWDLNKNQVTECYHDNKNRNISLFKAIPGVDLFIYIVDSSDEFVSVYLFG